MSKNFSELPLRTGVGIILLNNENKVFVARRIDNAKKFWQMPQGGVDDGEDFLKAAYRELEEETSVKSVELIKELDGTITYEAAGIKKISGKFSKGDHVKILDKKNNECARGLSSFTSDEIVKIMGHHSNQIEKLLGYVAKSEVIHKDDMVEI